MSAIPRFGRVAFAGAAALLLTGLAGCSVTLDKTDVATSIKAQLDKQNLGAGAVTCPADLKAEVGQSVRCEFTVDGQPVDAIATITSLEGSTANFDITTEARPIAKALLDRKIAEQLGEQLGVPIDSADCSGDLPATVDASVTCAVAGGGETGDFRVTVTEVNGGLINYSVDQA